MLSKRPISITILLILLLLLNVSTLIFLIKGVIDFLTTHDILISTLLFRLLRAVISIGLVSIAFWAVFTRKPKGRWLSVFFVLVLFLGATYMQFFSSPATRTFDRLEYQNPSLSNLVELFFAALVYGYWSYKVGFSTQARQYYDENYLQNLEQEKIKRELSDLNNQ